MTEAAAVGRAAIAAAAAAAAAAASELALGRGGLKSAWVRGSVGARPPGRPLCASKREQDSAYHEEGLRTHLP